MTEHKDEIDAIVEALSDHWDMDSPDPDQFECDCGYSLGNGTGGLDGRHRRHVAESIAQALATPPGSDGA